MKELISIQVKNNQQLVSARTLHKNLGLKKKFSAWWEQNSKGFENGSDYTWEPQSYHVQIGNGASRMEDDYLITIDMAKELCMMSKTEKGKEVRKYFIQVEKNWNSPDMIMHRALEISNSRVKELENKNEALAIQLEESNKKANYLDVILGTPDVMATTQIAADYGYGAKEFNKLLHRVGIQHKIHDQWILYKAYMSQGYVTTKVFTFKDSKGRDRAKPATYWTQKGRKLIYDVLKREEILPLIERDDIA